MSAPQEDNTSRASTRQLLLEAGRDILRERGPSAEVDVRLADALERTGYSTGAAYPIFGNQEGFQRELALYVASSFDWAGPDAISDELEEIIATSDSMEAVVRRATDRYFRVFCDNEDFYLALRFWAVRDPWPELDKSLADGYRVVHDGFVALFEGVLLLYGRRIRPAFTMDETTTAITALTEGLALRHRIEARNSSSPGAVEDLHAAIYSNAFAALVSYYTEAEPEAEQLGTDS